MVKHGSTGCKRFSPGCSPEEGGCPRVRGAPCFRQESRLALVDRAGLSAVSRGDSGYNPGWDATAWTAALGPDRPCSQYAVDLRHVAGIAPFQSAGPLRLARRDVFDLAVLHRAVHRSLSRDLQGRGSRNSSYIYRSGVGILVRPGQPDVVS